MADRFYNYGKQTIENDDIEAVIEVLKGDWLTQGPAVNRFEKALGDKFGAKHVTAVANGTAGLHLIGLALGWGKDDVVLTTPITFIASSNCIIYCGATPDLVDINEETYNIDIIKLEKKILQCKDENKRVKAVVAVDFAGNPCEWKELRKLADKYDFQLVNDNCHALGAAIDNDIKYAAKYADVVNMSFHPVKHITTGEGGAVLTNSEEIDEKIKLLRTHGLTKDPEKLIENEGPWFYEMKELGYNYRITDFQCALGLSQLKKLDSFISRRNQIAEYYNNVFKDDGRFLVPKVKSNKMHAYHLYPLQIDFENLKIDKRQFFIKMKELNIGLQVHYIPIHLQPYYKDRYNFSYGNFPEAELFYSREVSIPIYPLLTDQDLEYIVKVIKENLI